MKKEPHMKKQNRLVAWITQETNPSETDPFGSYTGRPNDPFEEPEQDADDL